MYCTILSPGQCAVNNNFLSGQLTDNWFYRDYFFLIPVLVHVPTLNALCTSGPLATFFSLLHRQKNGHLFLRDALCKSSAEEMQANVCYFSTVVITWMLSIKAMINIEFLHSDHPYKYVKKSIILVHAGLIYGHWYFPCIFPFQWDDLDKRSPC